MSTHPEVLAIFIGQFSRFERQLKSDLQEVPIRAAGRIGYSRVIVNSEGRRLSRTARRHGQTDRLHARTAPLAEWERISAAQGSKLELASPRLVSGSAEGS